jgi:hypothetical protein
MYLKAQNRSAVKYIQCENASAPKHYILRPVLKPVTALSTTKGREEEVVV